MEDINVSNETVAETPKTYTEEEVQALVSKGINGALSKYKEKQSKSTDQRVTELEAELARRDLQDKVRVHLKDNNIPEELSSLFTSEDYEDRVEVFNKWYASAIETAVKDKISGVNPINLNMTQPAAKKARHSLAEIVAKYE